MSAFIVINNVCVQWRSREPVESSPMEILKIRLGTVLGEPVPADPAPAALGPGDLKRLLPASVILGFVFPLRF